MSGEQDQHDANSNGQMPPANHWHVYGEFVEWTLRRCHNKPSVAVVWFTMFRFRTGKHVNIGIDRLVELTGYHRSTVIRAIQTLQKHGVLERVYRGQKSVGASTYLMFGVPKDAQDEANQRREQRAKKRKRKQRSRSHG